MLRDSPVAAVFKKFEKENLLQIMCAGKIQ